MVEKRGIKIYNFSVDEDEKELEKIFDSLLKMEDLIPIIGSGFTGGLKTQNGGCLLYTSTRGSRPM